jgi:hypothetical protein
MRGSTFGELAVKLAGTDSGAPGVLTSAIQSWLRFLIS